ncbi:TadE family protein [Microbacterium sp. cx-59]|uniref:TadE family protein n=1 Tax=Microbacterium sp. cx-59 TaxID=2891207 RepID=UPI001E473B67|nr:TadE family protein [Microbacterium sp. cx-59]MCC4906997.1 TadE family protein [Microbacterium sp. cx-59]
MPRSRPSTDSPREEWRSALADDVGSASLEFIVGGVLLLVPIIYLMLALGTIQGQTLGVEAAARHTARAISTATDAGDAAQRAELVLASIAAEYGVDPGELDVSWECTDSAGECPAAGATLVVTVRTRAELPFMPPIFGLDQIAAVPVEASAVQKVSRFWGTAP